MRTHPNERVDTQARVLEGLAIDVTRSLEHIQNELRSTDWHTGDNADNTGSTSKGGEPVSPTERVALARYELTWHREEIRDWITALESITRSGRVLVDNALKIRTPHTELFDATEYGKRCKHPTCEQWASEHRLPLTSSINDDWCDMHWPSACMVHGNHEHDQRRVDGVLACQDAYRKWRRETLKETA